MRGSSEPPVVSCLLTEVTGSIWMTQTQAVFHHAGVHMQAGENPELRTIYFRLARLLKLPVVPIFVFDGPGRPPVKRGKQVRSKPHWLTDGFKRLVDAFGFHSHDVSTSCSVLTNTTMTDHLSW